MSLKIHMLPHLLMGRQLIGDRVKQLRSASGWSQTGLANRAGVSRNAIVRMETSTQGHLPIDAYLVVADALEIPPWRLFRDGHEAEWLRPGPGWRRPGAIAVVADRVGVRVDRRDVLATPVAAALEAVPECQALRFDVVSVGRLLLAVHADRRTVAASR
ncbi:helix-turn-helix domain-containing protein [Kitasatospora fiedleri]|uniref:helix-turn-helix domain-containing protein n=1 Tax=Kitasatospora fiedleri TaxID=2991545 RepID=UPI00249A8C5D|nr:helix-turn-helix domain-containing protein [Kitasatospora fiedleri]